MTVLLYNTVVNTAVGSAFDAVLLYLFCSRPGLQAATTSTRRGSSSSSSSRWRQPRALFTDVITARQRPALIAAFIGGGSALLVDYVARVSSSTARSSRRTAAPSRSPPSCPPRRRSPSRRGRRAPARARSAAVAASPDSAALTGRPSRRAGRGDLAVAGCARRARGRRGCTPSSSSRRRGRWPRRSKGAGRPRRTLSSTGARLPHGRNAGSSSVPHLRLRSAYRSHQLVLGPSRCTTRCAAPRTRWLVQGGCRLRLPQALALAAAVAGIAIRTYLRNQKDRQAAQRRRPRRRGVPRGPRALRLGARRDE